MVQPEFRARRSLLLAVCCLASITLCGCRDNANRASTPVTSAAAVPSAPTVPLQATLPSLAPAGLKQLAISRKDSIGGWNADLAGDGPLDIVIACVGGGEIAVSYRSPSHALGSFRESCDGKISNNYDEAAPSGRITVAIKPDGNQHWSARLARGAKS